MLCIAALAIEYANASDHVRAMESNMNTQAVRYRSIQVDGLSIFYREAGRKDAPAILLLHGFPSSSRMFNPLLERLSGNYHLVAPDYPGFGLTKAFRKACVAVSLGKWRDEKNHDAGYDGLTLHDLRRSGVRNLRRAKVAEDIAMKISGHRTASVFKRYNIVDSDDLHDAMRSVTEYVKSKSNGASR